MGTRLERIGLQVVMGLSAINIWTGAPLLAIYVGGLFAESTRVSMTVVFLVVVVLFATCLGLTWTLSWASTAYDRLSGHERSVKRHVPWLRSVRGERVNWERERNAVTPLERLLVISVVLAILAFEAWFFIAAPSPIEPGPAKD
jgi:hypothetical protein